MNDEYNVGIEIEFLIPEDCIGSLTEDLAKRGFGRWSIVTDSSVRRTSNDFEGYDDFEGYELVSPKIVLGDDPKDWERLKWLVTEVTDIIKENEGQTNTTCGLHIHLSPKRGWSPRYLLIVSCLYYAYHNFLYSAMPLSRRHSDMCMQYKHRFMNSFSGLLSKELIKPRYVTLSSLENLWYENNEYLKASGARKRYKYDNTRYSGINLHSVFYRGSLEVRMHNGTLSPEKITNWIKLNVKIFSKANELQNLKNKETKKELVNLSTIKYPYSVNSILEEIQTKDKELGNYFFNRITKFGLCAE